MYRADMQCILCQQTIVGRTKPEHILLNTLGGRAVVRDIVCSDCNGAMGRGPDHDLADSVAMLRNIGHLLSGDGGAPPIIHGMTSEGMTFDVTPGMQVKPRHRGKKVNVNKQGEEIKISIAATNERELDILMRGAARSVAKELGHSEPKVIEAIHADLLRDHKRNDAIVPAPSIRSQFQFGTGRSQQSMAKATLVLWARLVGSKEVIRSRYDQIRSFIWNGDKPTDPETLVKLDYRALPEIPEQFGTNPNLIQVVSDESGAVYGYFRLYGAIGWRFLLCASGAPPNRACSLVSNPFQNEIFQLDREREAILPPTWILADWNLDLTNMSPVADRMEFLMAQGQKISRHLMLENWVNEACQQCGCKEGDYLTEQHVKFISEYVSKRMVVYLTRTPIQWNSDRTEATQ